MTPILVTGTAGFIGYHVASRLLADGHAVVGLDVVNAYYDPKLKESRLSLLAKFPAYRHERVDLADAEAMRDVFARHSPARVIHLAAQAGVRHSLEHPEDYVQSNLVGFLNILECCRHGGVKHLLYASSSSVYGSNRSMPFGEEQAVDHPLSIYAATKKAKSKKAAPGKAAAVTRAARLAASVPGALAESSLDDHKDDSDAAQQLEARRRQRWPRWRPRRLCRRRRSKATAG